MTQRQASWDIIYAIDGAEDEEIAKSIELYKNLPEDRKRKINAIKLGLPCLVRKSVSIIESIKKDIPGLDIICDFKISDVPHVSTELAQIAEGAGADGIVVQGFMGGLVVERLIQEIHTKLSIYLVTKMSQDRWLSHKDALQLLALGIQFRIKGIIISGFDLKLISIARQYIERERKKQKIMKNKCNLIAAGIKNQGADGPAALRAGANCLIVGRALTQVFSELADEDLSVERHLWRDLLVKLRCAYYVLRIGGIIIN